VFPNAGPDRARPARPPRRGFLPPESGETWNARGPQDRRRRALARPDERAGDRRRFRFPGERSAEAFPARACSGWTSTPPGWARIGPGRAPPVSQPFTSRWPPWTRAATPWPPDARGTLIDHLVASSRPRAGKPGGSQRRLHAVQQHPVRHFTAGDRRQGHASLGPRSNTRGPAPSWGCRRAVLPPGLRAPSTRPHRHPRPSRRAGGAYRSTSCGQVLLPGLSKRSRSRPGQYSHPRRRARSCRARPAAGNRRPLLPA